MSKLNATVIHLTVEAGDSMGIERDFLSPVDEHYRQVRFANRLDARAVAAVLVASFDVKQIVFVHAGHTIETDASERAVQEAITEVISRKHYHSCAHCE